MSLGHSFGDDGQRKGNANGKTLAKTSVGIVTREARGVYLRYKSRETSYGVDNSRTSREISREACPEPRTPKDKGETESEKRNTRYDLGKMPDFSLHRGEFELVLSGHSHETAHHSLVPNRETNSRAIPLHYERGGEGKVASFQRIVGRVIDRTGDHVTAIERCHLLLVYSKD